MSGSASKRPRVDCARAALRLAHEQLKPIRELAEAEGLAPARLTRYAIHGCRGAFLDAVHRPEVGWLSSTAAVARFKADFEKLTGRAWAPSAVSSTG